MNKISLQCNKCGEKISTGVKFCGFCGVKVDDRVEERNIPDYDSDFNGEKSNKQLNMNSRQKLIFSLTVPLVIIVIALGIAEDAGYKSNGGAFDWERTWVIWAIALAAIGKFEYWLSSK